MNTTLKSRLIIGCGYLGRRVARRWIDAGNQVFALTRSSDHADELSALGIQPVIGDVLSPTSLQSLPATTTLLYAVGYDRSGDASKRVVYVNGLRNVLAALPDSVDRIVYVSSTSVYGQSSGERVDESSICEPTSEGGQICLDAERLLQDKLTGRIGLHILRLSGIYGPRRLIARIDALRAGQHLTSHPDGCLNLIHVDDATTAVLTCAERDAGRSPVTLVSDDCPIQRREFYETVAKLVDAPEPTFAPPPNEAPDLGKCCDNRRLREEWGVNLTFPTINEGLPHAIGEL
ncbi:MAG: SDR family oxidoreductase [Planctomycetaceae bacterium]|nr:SDR family oxidoreductase [Planctomycetaceae bacterium]